MPDVAMTQSRATHSFGLTDFTFLGLGGVVDEGGEEPGKALRGRDDARSEERLVP